MMSNNEGGSYAYDEPLLSRSPRYTTSSGDGSSRRNRRTRRNFDEHQHAPPQHAFLLSPATNASPPTTVDDDEHQGDIATTSISDVGDNNDNSVSNDPIDVFHIMCKLLYGHHETTIQEHGQSHRQSRQQERTSSSSPSCLISTTQTTLFWSMMVVFAIVLGVLVGILSVAFVAAHAVAVDYWFRYSHFDNTTILFDGNGNGSALNNDDIFLLLPSSTGHHWKWIIITTVGGGFLSGVLQILVTSERTSSTISGTNCLISGGLGLLLHRTASTIMEGSSLQILCHDILLILCSLVALSAGVPLGACLLFCLSSGIKMLFKSTHTFLICILSMSFFVCCR